MMQVRSARNLGLGLVYVALAGVALAIGSRYQLGTPSEMGPNFFPMTVSAALMVCGIVSIVRGLLVRADPVGPFSFKPLLLVTGAVVVFGLLLRPAGLVIALPILIMTGAAASSEFRLAWAPLVGIALLLGFCFFVFGWFLGLPIPLIGEFFATWR